MLNPIIIKMKAVFETINPLIPEMCVLGELIILV
jgi:hypothetical protein